MDIILATELGPLACPSRSAPQKLSQTNLTLNNIYSAEKYLSTLSNKKLNSTDTFRSTIQNVEYS